MTPKTRSPASAARQAPSARRHRTRCGRQARARPQPAWTAAVPPPFLLAQGDIAQARDIYERIASQPDLDYIVTELDDLAHALPESSEIRKIREHLIEVAWPDGCEIDLQHVNAQSALASTKRGDYPFPNYCHLDSIAGLESDCQLAKRIFTRHRHDDRAVVLWSIDPHSRVYGQCNFKTDDDKDHVLKFCDEASVVLSKTLDSLVRDYNVRRLYFLEEELLNDFQEAVEEGDYPVVCKLVFDD